MVQPLPSDVYRRIMAQAGPLTRQDIADLLASCAEPGAKRDYKKRLVMELCQEKGGGKSMDGHPIHEDLGDFPQF